MQTWRLLLGLVCGPIRPRPDRVVFLKEPATTTRMARQYKWLRDGPQQLPNCLRSPAVQPNIFVSSAIKRGSVRSLTHRLMT
jgi:hypothetical protein